MPRDELYLAELVAAAREVTRYLHGVTTTEWHQDSMLRSAVLHQLTIIGEIARGLSDDTRQRHPDIPWAQMRAFRNIAVHSTSPSIPPWCCVSHATRFPNSAARH